jgi:hypothetical protein
VRGLAVLLAVLLLALLAAGGYTLIRAELGRNRRAAAARARWSPRTRVEGAVTVVSVCRALASGEAVDDGDGLVVARLAADDPEFDQRYADAMALARMRAAAFNAELDGG